MSEIAEEVEQPTAEIIQLHTKAADEKCSFCGTPRSKAKNMVTNKRENKSICGTCIVKGLAIVRGEGHVSN